MTERSVEAFRIYRESQVRFDYVIFGLAAALFAYLGEKYVPEPISLSQNSFEFAALICLGLSLIGSFARLEKDVQTQRLGFKKLDMSEER